MTKELKKQIKKLEKTITQLQPEGFVYETLAIYLLELKNNLKELENNKN